MEPNWKFQISQFADRVLYPKDKCNYLGKKLLNQIFKIKDLNKNTKNDERSINGLILFYKCKKLIFFKKTTFI